MHKELSFENRLAYENLILLLTRYTLWKSSYIDYISSLKNIQSIGISLFGQDFS